MTKETENKRWKWIEIIGGYLKNLEMVDYRIIVSVVFLLMFGLIMIYSASSNKYGISMMRKQFLVGVLGIVLMLLISFIDYHIYARWAWVLYFLSVGSLFLVKVPGLGQTKNGASRWIEIAGQSFQPAELLKPAMVILMAVILTKVAHRMIYYRAALSLMLPCCAAVALILLVTQNLSTAIIVLGIAVGMFFVAHPNKKIWVWVFGVAVLGIVLVFIYYNLKIVPAVESGDFRANRILAWLYPEKYPEISMQSRYSLYAIGFGGLLGRGLGSGTMKYYIPEPMNDFIFAVIAEELGLVGCGLLLILFLYQIFRIMTVAQHARDLVGSYMAVGIGVHVALQVILNIGVATSLLPNTGISLPYISYGGTALLLQLCEIGIVLNISRQIPGKRVKVEGTSQQETDHSEMHHQRIA